MPISPSVVCAETEVALPDHRRRSTATSSTVISATRISLVVWSRSESKRSPDDLAAPPGVSAFEDFAALLSQALLTRHVCCEAGDEGAAEDILPDAPMTMHGKWLQTGRRRTSR